MEKRTEGRDESQDVRTGQSRVKARLRKGGSKGNVTIRYRIQRMRIECVTSFFEIKENTSRNDREG